MPVNDYLVPLVTCTLTDAIICLDIMLICYCLLNTIIVIIIVLGFFVVIAMLYTSIGIGIARGQYYRILGAFLGIVLTLMTAVQKRRRYISTIQFSVSRKTEGLSSNML